MRSGVYTRRDDGHLSQLIREPRVHGGMCRERVFHEFVRQVGTVTDFGLHRQRRNVTSGEVPVPRQPARDPTDDPQTVGRIDHYSASLYT
jgi:hypothetical protein